MKKIFLLFLLLSILITACTKFDTEKDSPQCINQKIKDFSNSIVCDDAKVDKYLYQEKAVYAFNPGSCGADLTTEIIDSECNTIGYFGGIDGNRIINGEDFSNAIFVKTIWKNKK